MDRAGFRTAVENYRRPTGFTQKELARAMGLHPKTLSHKLHGSDGASLRHDDVRAIVRTLTEWGALRKRTQAIELLALMSLGRDGFTPTEWAASPLVGLEADGEPPPIERRNGRGGSV